MIKRLGQSKTLHRTVIVNNMAYFAGIVADDFSLDMEGQTRQICQKLDGFLAAAGTDKTKLVTAQIFVTDLGAKEGMNKAWSEWLPAESLPTRATIGIADLGQNVLIEVVVSAVVE